MYPICDLIADDLTGACDSSAQFARTGFSSTVILDRASMHRCSAQVIGASTDSREDSPVVAARKVQRWSDFLCRGSTPIAFKKIDSTLRGNVAVEIEAAMQAFGCSIGIVAPAFPAMGRTVVDGYLCVAGAEDAARIHIPTLLEQQGLSGLVHLGRTALAGDPESLRARLEDYGKASARLIVIDSSSDSELDVVAQATYGLKRRPIWIGSAGLAAALARTLARERRPAGPDSSGCKMLPGPAGPAILFVGSDHPVTLEQLKHLAALRSSTFVTLSPENIVRGRLALNENRHLAIAVERDKADESSLPYFLAGLKPAPIRGLMMTGGDTASLVCRALGADSITLCGEIAAGIPWGRLAGGAADGLAVATKSGGFGASDALAVALDFLARCPGAPESLDAKD